MSQNKVKRFIFVPDRYKIFYTTDKSQGVCVDNLPVLQRDTEDATNFI